MAKKTRIGLDANASKELAASLNRLLANYQIFYMNLRGFHWNVKGVRFFELHLKFEELYNDTQLKIDEIAERILALGHTPIHSFTEYLKTAELQEQVNVSDGKTAVEFVLRAYQKLIDMQRKLLTMSAKYDDEGTNSMMSDYIRQQEKLTWMFDAYLY